MKNLFILLLVCLFSFLLFTYKITEVPPGINGDEAGIGYNSILISRNLTDENHNFLPLFIFAKGSDWKQPVTVYTTALFFRIFGVSYWLLRATSIFFILAALVILYLISKEFMGTNFFLISSLILITTPIVLIQSHLALENIAPLPFVLFWLWTTLKFEKTKKTYYLFWGGTSLGIGLFSYLGMRLIVPVLTFLTLIYLKKHIKQSIYFILGISPFFLLLLVAYFRYPSAVFGNFSGATQSVYEFLLRYLSIFDFSFLFFKGDITAYHSTGKAGMFLAATLPLFLIGVFKILCNKKPFEILILLSFFLSPVLFGLVPDIYRASRLLALVPFYAIISAVGFLSISKKPWIIFFVIIMAINYFYFVKDYWFDYAERVKKVFPIPIERTYEFHIKE